MVALGTAAEKKLPGCGLGMSYLGFSDKWRWEIIGLRVDILPE